MPKAIWFVGTTRNSYVEMGKNNNGFVFKAKPKPHWNMTPTGSIRRIVLYQIRAIHSLRATDSTQLEHEDPEKFKKPLKDRTNFVNSLASCKRRQRSYANIRRKPLEFQVGNRVCEVTPSTRHIELPEKLSSIHNTFNVSNLKKCLSDESFVIPINELQLDDKLNFVEEPVEVMDREIKQLKRSRIPIIKVRWNSKRGPEFTWEREDEICAKYPHLFSIITSSSIKSRDEISVRGGDYNNPQFS
ncbi:hypothetical protein Tco_0134062 [Tanacetum coccineum]